MLLSAAPLWGTSLAWPAKPSIDHAHHMLHFPPHLPKDQSRLCWFTTCEGLLVCKPRN